MTEKLNGTWTLDRTENFEEFMKEYGISVVLRKIAATIKIKLEIKNEGDKWTIRTISTFKNDFDEFILGIEFDKDTQDGRKAKVLCKIEGDKLIGEQRDRKTSVLQVIGTKYVNENDELVEELLCNNVKSLRFYKRVKQN